MKNERKILPEEALEKGGEYLVYHLKMYVKTLSWLLKNPKPSDWDTVRNAVLEDHLIHARILIEFLCYDKGRSTDIFAQDYFQKEKKWSLPSDLEYLKEQSRLIGGQLVHLTTKAVPKRKSEQEWEIREIAVCLVKEMWTFIEEVENPSFGTGKKGFCMNLLYELIEFDIPKHFSPST